MKTAADHVLAGKAAFRDTALASIKAGFSQRNASTTAASRL
jgi:hypothetical protein